MEHITVIDQLRHLPSTDMVRVDKALRDGVSLADAYRVAGLCRTCGQTPDRCPAGSRVERKKAPTLTRRGLKVGVVMAGWIGIAAVLALVLSGCTGDVTTTTDAGDAGVCYYWCTFDAAAAGDQACPPWAVESWCPGPGPGPAPGAMPITAASK